MAYTPRVLFLIKERTHNYCQGHSSGLANAAKMAAATLRHHGLEADVAVAHDGNDVDRLVARYHPSHVVIEALWVTPEKMAELLPRHRGRRWYVRLHSKAPFLAADGPATGWLAAYARLADGRVDLHIAANSAELADDLSVLLRTRAVHLPNIYRSRFERDSVAFTPRPFLDVGCFGAARPLKNQYIQAIAALRTARALDLCLRFHMNEADPNQSPAFKNIQALFAAAAPHALVLHPWLDHEDFLDLVTQTDIGMQVSFSESFNIVAADYVSQGVPVVVSPDIEWMPRDAVADPNSSAAIAAALRRELHAPRSVLVARNKDALERYNHAAYAAWAAALGL